MRLPIWHTRLVPDLAGGPPLVHDLARNVLADFEIADVWQGPATLGFEDSEFEELAALAPVEVVGGFRCSVAFTITGAEVRPA
jgi:acetoacetate decarboxylase